MLRALRDAPVITLRRSEGGGGAYEYDAPGIIIQTNADLARP